MKIFFYFLLTPCTDIWYALILDLLWLFTHFQLFLIFFAFSYFVLIWKLHKNMSLKLLRLWFESFKNEEVNKWLLRMEVWTRWILELQIYMIIWNFEINNWFKRYSGRSSRKKSSYILLKKGKTLNRVPEKEIIISRNV